MLHFLRCSLFFLLFFTQIDRIHACGYNFLGDCPTSIFLEINNTSDSFYVAPCTFGTQFDALNFGKIQSLRLTKLKGATWESCENNVTAMQFFYRIYPSTSGASGNFLKIDLPETYFTLEGPYTTRYRNKSLNINLLSGLTSGVEYTLEAYFMAQVDTIGDDFIPETVIFDNHFGQNYHITFMPVVSNAPPFSVVLTKKRDLICADDSSGMAQVTVYGPQNFLFYEWSNGNGNFFATYNLTPGIYTVTVTGDNNVTQTRSIPILAQSDLQNQMIDLHPLACNGSPGSATADVSGGVPPLKFIWNTLETTPTGHFPQAGTWWLTVTDAVGCTKEFFTNIGVEPIPTIQLEKTICEGEKVQFGGQSFQQSGTFEVRLSGKNGNCDTLLTLKLNILPAPDGQGKGICNIQCGTSIFTVQLSVQNPIPNFLYQWQFPGGGAVAGLSAIFQTSIFFQLDSIKLLITNTLGCQKLVSVPVQIIQQTDVPAVSLSDLKATCDGKWQGNIKISGGLPPFQIAWNTPLASGNEFILPPGNYQVTVTGGNQCFIVSALNLDVYDILKIDSISIKNASNATTSDGSLTPQILSGCSNFCHFLWSNGQNSPTATMLLPGSYCITVTNNLNCTAVACAEVKTSIPTKYHGEKMHPLQLYPNPTTDFLQIEIPEDFLQSGAISLQILNQKGKNVLEMPVFLPIEQLQITTQFLPAGVYQIKLSTEKFQIAWGSFIKI